MISVLFNNNSMKVAGNLYVPGNLSSPVPGVITIGPMAYTKEQAPTQYAKRLAAHGFVALAFDPRYRGESEGTPRDYENPLAQVEVEGQPARVTEKKKEKRYDREYEYRSGDRGQSWHRS